MTYAPDQRISVFLFTYTLTYLRRKPTRHSAKRLKQYLAAASHRTSSTFGPHGATS